MIDDSEKRKRRLAFELQDSHVCEKRSKYRCVFFHFTFFSSGTAPQTIEG